MVKSLIPNDNPSGYFEMTKGGQDDSVTERQDISANIKEKNCNACTLLNPVDAVLCSICGTPFKLEDEESKVPKQAKTHQ